MKIVTATNKEVNGHIVLEITEGDFKGIQFYYQGVKSLGVDPKPGELAMARLKVQ